MSSNRQIVESTIHINRESVATVSIVRADGTKTNKFTTLDAVREALTSDQAIRTELLPPGCRQYQRGNGAKTIIIESPPMIRTVQYADRDAGKTESFTIPIPWTLWKFNLRETDCYMSTAYVWAMKTPLLPGKENTNALCDFPFSNVSPSEHRICWGGSEVTMNTMRSVKTLNDVPRLIELFWSCPFNGDYSQRHRYNVFNNEDNKEVALCKDLIKFLDKKPVFPYDILVPEISVSKVLR